MKKNHFLVPVLLVVLIILGIYSFTNRRQYQNIEASDQKTTNQVAGTNTNNQIDQESSETEESPAEKLNLKIESEGKKVSYDGQNDQTVLDLLKQVAEVKTEDSSFGPMIISINGVEQTKEMFWLYSINGKAGMEGAHVSKTKTGDRIEWTLSNGM